MVAADAASLEWWKMHNTQFPTIAKLALKYLAIPASSAPSERVFSRAKLIQEHQRWSLPPQWLETSVLIKHNDALKEISQCYKDVPLALSIICSVTLHIYSHQYDLLLCHNHLHNMPINVLAGTWDNYGHIKCVIQSHHFSCIV